MLGLADTWLNHRLRSSSARPRSVSTAEVGKALGSAQLSRPAVGPVEVPDRY